MSIKISHRLSKIFQPIISVSRTAIKPKQDVTSKSQRLMLELGIIHQASPGAFHFLPLGLKSLDKLIKLVDDEMFKIQGQKVSFPSLTNSKLWKSSGRLETAGPELFQLNDRHHHSYILSPTHEEVASDLVSSLAPISYKQFPLRLYQMTSKFRDEMKPRFGLMRGREFLMKDMYSFDIDVESAKKTYDKVRESYNNIFKKIGVDFIQALGNAENMGGTLSHEFHFVSKIGEDRVLLCKSCNSLTNIEMCVNEQCPNCKDKNIIEVQNTIEVGHTFLLGDRYSKPLKSFYLTKSGKPEVLQMGSYGLGLSRIVAAAIEVLSFDLEIRWPDVLAPYIVVILPPKAGSKEALVTQNIEEKLYFALEDQIPELKNNVLIDDRLSYTIGRRYLEAKRMGYHFIVVINDKVTETIPLYEVNDIKNNVQLYLSENELISYIIQNSWF